MVLLSFTYACEEDVKLVFSENLIETSEAADISINIPKAEGSSEVANRINLKLYEHIVNQSNLSEDASNQSSLDVAIKQFNTEYSKFKKDFPDSSQQWEYFVDGEVTYRSEVLVCIAINSYLDTGGAHGNTNVTFFNFNPQTGELYNMDDIVNDRKALSEVVEQKLNENLKSKAENDSMEDYFFGKEFQLPETLGFSDEGLIILYNTYEIASYAQGIVEFTIPFSEVETFLNYN